jgi:hypothetical protein
MSESQTTQTEETTQPAKTEAPEVTLDDVYRDAGLDKIVETQQPPQRQEQQQQPQKIEPSSVPDPYDTENFKAYQARLVAETSALRQNQASIANYLTGLQRKEAQATLEADISKSVEKVNEVVNHPKPKVIEAMLDAEARENPKFKALWENRAKNPVAWDNALKITAKKFADDLSVKVDPALVAAQRARKDSQKQMATTAPEEPDEKWLDDSKFSDQWEQLLGR